MEDLKKKIEEIILRETGRVSLTNFSLSKAIAEFISANYVEKEKVIEKVAEAVIIATQESFKQNKAPF